MCVKLPAMLNIQPEYVFSVGEMHIVCGYHYFVTKNKKKKCSKETLSAAIKTVVSAY